MKIIIDARMINASGIGRYLRNLISELQKLDHENEYFILLLNEDFIKEKFNENFHKVLADFRWYSVKEQLELPKILKKINPDLVHFPHFNVPIWYSGKYVVTIHDLIHQHYGNQNASTKDPVTFKIKKIGYDFVFKKAVNGSQKILTPSNFVKAQLENEWSIPGNKIVVTPEGVDNRLFDMGKSALPKGVNPPFIFYVGNAHPHKNVEGLIRSFLEVRKNYQYLQLVLAGKESSFWKKIKEKYNEKSIIFTGEVTDGELAALYKSAKVFVMPSFEEGFGIPNLEAMALGCPVVSSNAGSLKEVGGDGALYFDPGDQSSMGNQISRVLNDNKLREGLIKKGKLRVKKFSWQKMAVQTLEIYRSF